MAYTGINKSTDFFNTKIYTGNSSSSHAITGVGFKPDWLWLKNRTASGNHFVVDVIRGANKVLVPNDSDAEATESYVTSLDSDGFTLGSASNNVNGSYNYVAWNWLAGGSQGSSNTDGSINTTYTSVNTTAGFSISQYTGTGSNATVGHGLGVVPDMILVKSLSGGGDWTSYHSVLGNTKFMRLNSTNASATQSSYWNDTSPTSTVFSLGSAGDTNTNGGTHVAYCFAEKKGYSKFGTYTGNSDTDGTFVYTGFRPSFVIYKGASGTGAADNWEMVDDKRSPSNGVENVLYPNLANAEGTGVTTRMDLVSNGFKMRTSGSDYNNSSATYIYMAFGQTLVGSNNVPCTAR